MLFVTNTYLFYIINIKVICKFSTQNKIMNLSVIIPVYNEVDSILRLYKELSDVLSNFDWYEIFLLLNNLC